MCYETDGLSGYCMIFNPIMPEVETVLEAESKPGFTNTNAGILMANDPIFHLEPLVSSYWCRVDGWGLPFSDSNLIMVLLSA